MEAKTIIRYKNDQITLDNYQAPPNLRNILHDGIVYYNLNYLTIIQDTASNIHYTIIIAQGAELLRYETDEMVIQKFYVSGKENYLEVSTIYNNESMIYSPTDFKYQSYLEQLHRECIKQNFNIKLD